MWDEEERTFKVKTLWTCKKETREESVVNTSTEIQKFKHNTTYFKVCSDSKQRLDQLKMPQSTADLFFFKVKNSAFSK